ncbi:MAG: GNAT family N-acetyltransferase, partial [Candidatus Thermoplasmatota archaeon]|nr:GNAT family N-acetyltransferase [Candidatus Thermoplasmatota archaeon]
ISFHRNTCRIISIAVHPLCRKKGVGKKLLASAEEKAQQLNIKNIVLEVSTKNRDAINFYLSNKYKIDHVIENYYGIGRDAYRMRKNLGELTD